MKIKIDGSLELDHKPTSAAQQYDSAAQYSIAMLQDAGINRAY